MLIFWLHYHQLCDAVEGIMGTAIVNVRACSAFSGVRSAIPILQVSLQSLNKSGPDTLIFFNNFFQSSKVALKVSNLTDVLGI